MFKDNSLPEVRPCPYCSKAMLLEKHHYDDVISYGIHCDCNFANRFTENLGSFKKRQNPKFIIKKWNSLSKLILLIKRVKQHDK